jgi:hypothetical protein
LKVRDDVTSATSQTPAPAALCEECRLPMIALNDEVGALTREFLLARGSCCTSDCRNCPYESRDDHSLPLARLLECERCGRPFACGTTACWCRSIRLSDAASQTLQETHADCVCPVCLGEFASATTKHPKKSKRKRK